MASWLFIILSDLSNSFVLRIGLVFFIFRGLCKFWAKHKYAMVSADPNTGLYKQTVFN
jgi:hypothetical protein